MLKLCTQDGYLDMTPEAIAARTRVPLKMVKDAIAELEAPDALSRTRDHDGKRLIRIDPERPWGWRIVNYVKYRQIKKEFDRQAYMRDYMHDKRVKQQCETSSLTQSNGGLTSPSASGSVQEGGAGEGNGSDLTALADWQITLDLERTRSMLRSEQDRSHSNPGLCAALEIEIARLVAEKCRRSPRPKPKPKAKRVVQEAPKSTATPELIAKLTADLKASVK